jgi:hypothetical protein
MTEELWWKEEGREQVIKIRGQKTNNRRQRQESS